MTPHAHFPCARTAAVLALHLDGDLDVAADDTHGYAFVDAATLHDHLRDCGSCRATLRRARRLDAALANAAGAAVSSHQRRPGATLPELQARWFDALPGRGALAAPGAGAAPAVPPATAHSAPPWVLLASAAALAAVVAFVGTFAGSSSAPASYLPGHLVAAARATPAPAPAPELAAPPAVPGHAVLAPLAASPDSVRQLQQRRPAPPASEAAPVASGNAAAALVADRDGPATRRIAATQALLEACRASGPAAELALRQLVGALAACGSAGTPVALHARQLELLRDTGSARAARALLAAWLQQLDDAGAMVAGDDVAAIAVAARLGTTELDAALRRLARRHDETGEYVAAALRCGVRPQGGARLLLDLWQENDARRGGGPDVSIAQRWFGAQPAVLFTELIAELRASRASARRLHCLLALGAAGDDCTLAALLECAQSRHRDEAVAAAFALSCLPRRVLDAAVPLAAADEAWLLRAALARARHEAARPWLEALAPRSAERLFDADLARFAEVAGCFRERNNSSD